MDTIVIEKKQYEELLARLEKISTLLALDIVKDSPVQKDKIMALSAMGFGATEISKMLNTTAGTVNVALARARKEKLKKTTEPEKLETENREIDNPQSDTET